MRALLLTAAALVGPALSAPAPSYIPFEPFELALHADLIVDGVVVAFDEAQPSMFRDDEHKTITLEVREVVAGKDPGERIVVQAFGNWTCHARYAPYTKDQRAVFFLRYPRTKAGEVEAGKPIQILGAGNEGESPVVGELVFHRGFGLDGFKRAETKAFGHRYFGIATPRKEFLEVVRGLRSSFEWKGARQIWGADAIKDLRQTCTDAELTEYRASSKLAEAIVRDARDARRLRRE
jgi:hypothetical protein